MVSLLTDTRLYDKLRTCRTSLRVKEGERVTVLFPAIIAKEPSSNLTFWFLAHAVYEEKNCEMSAIWSVALQSNIQGSLDLLNATTITIKWSPVWAIEQDGLELPTEWDWKSSSNCSICSFVKGRDSKEDCCSGLVLLA